MSKYTYLACDWSTLQVIEELPLSGVKFSSGGLNRVGILSATCSLGNNPQAILNATEATKTVLFVDRDGVLVWGGPIWSRPFKSGSNELVIGAASYGSYFQSRVFDQRMVYSNWDQVDIARDFVLRMQQYAGGDYRVSLGERRPSGVLRDRVYEKEAFKQVHEALTQLAEVNNGFDFSFDVRYDSEGNPSISYETFYPHRGVGAQDTTTYFDYPGTILNYEWPDDGTGFATAVYLTGGQPGTNTADQQTPALTSQRVRTDLLDQRFPLLQKSFSLNDITRQNTLDDYAEEYARAVSSSARTMKIQVDPETMGEWSQGDFAHLSLSDRRFPSGMSVMGRILEVEIAPSGTGSVETVTLTMDLVP